MRIIVAIDKSTCSKTALSEAIYMDCPVFTEIKVVTVLDYSEPLPVLELIQSEECDAAKKLVESAVDQLKEAHPLAEVSGEVLDGYPDDAIIKLSRTWLADLIIVGSHGRKGISKLWLGSVSRAILLHAPCAVRVARPGPHAETTQGGKNVLLALDGSEHSEHLIDHVLAFPWFEGTQFRCLHVVHPVAAALDDQEFEHQSSSFDGFIGQQHEWLEKQAARINEVFDQPVATGKILIGEAREQILLNAIEWPADLVVLGSHGRRGIDKLIMGSVSDAISNNAPLLR